MLTVRDLMRTDVVTLEPEETLRSVVDTLVSAGADGAAVVSGGQLVGVLSLSDVLAFEAAEPGVPTYRPEMAGVGDGDEPGEAEAEEEASAWFREMWEDVGPDVLARLETTEGPEWDELDQHTVAEVMTRKVLTVAPRASLRHAAHLMDSARVHRLIVTDGAGVLGLLSALDLVHAIAEGQLVTAPPRKAGQA